jgi:hypothetical protein
MDIAVSVTGRVAKLRDAAEPLEGTSCPHARVKFKSHAWGDRMKDVEWNRLANLGDEHIGPREEDVKFKVVVPILRLLGFTALDFSFETPADLGRMDITVKGFPIGVVVECKGPNARLEDCVLQVERIGVHLSQEPQ